MDLRTFVSETLKEIVNGVDIARLACHDNEAQINPVMEGLAGETKFGLILDSGQLLQMVEFQVVLTTTHGGEQKEGIGVMFANIGLGKQNMKEQSSGTETMVRFSVPLVWPKEYKAN